MRIWGLVWIGLFGLVATGTTAGGITTVLIPQENEKDVAEIPANIREGLTIIPVSHVDEVLKLALVQPLVAIEWTEADEFAALPVAGAGAEAEPTVRH